MYHCYKINYIRRPEELDCETVSDLLSQSLAEYGFESFEYQPNGLYAYIPTELSKQIDIKEAVSNFPLPGLEIDYEAEEQPDIDWNHEWESKYFQPVRINEFCRIRAPFHPEDKTVDFDILISPKMAFGTGNHQTTALVADTLFFLDLLNLQVLDMGCGTGILSIIASLRGAKTVTAIDIDNWAIENTRENARLNKIDNITSLVADASQLPCVETYDLIVANIMRNVLLEDMPQYTQCLKRGGKLLMSGFYAEDIQPLKERAVSLGLTPIDHRTGKEGWSILIVSKLK
ncbi:hypothetical protein HQ45_07215 [Porphyromonas crevioricanis]|uniref:Ribosomal protein L11 methyltransferase n=1 Tax=Porphyromonas crevioricanis TaxID=393921 RepID=A0AB34PEJ2_9PORP|nr:hypothetical protein HQ45_07215 [Porphyromonas crevioricanis]KGN93698.1 hypothetical protein HQ38_08660 [Porphyromonas crevioricanis]